MRRRRAWVLVVIGLALCTMPLQAQTDRFELGQRLRALEIAWDAQPDAEARKRTTPFLRDAVHSYFRLKPAMAARNLDLARFALQSKEAPSEKQLWANGLMLVPESRFLDVSAESLAVAIKSCYSPLDALPEVTLGMDLEWKTDDGRASHGTAASLDKHSVKLLFGMATTVPEGDHFLTLSLSADGKNLACWNQTVSFVRNRDHRLNALRQFVESLGDAPDSVESATLRSNLRILESLAKGHTLETNYPAARLLWQSEGAAKSLKDKEAYFGLGWPGQFWLSLPTGKTISACRLLAPVDVTERKPLPLVIAMHGMGGSENMFFDTYGNGAIAELCKKRGWLLIAPRSMPFGAAPLPELIDAIDKLYPVDKKHVFVIGHSMGAGQAIAAAMKNSERFAAVAALAGGGVVKKAPDLDRLPFFVGVGTEDVAHHSSKQVAKELTEAGANRTRLKEYADIEHLTIVQVALPDIFQFFDEALKGK